MLDIDNAVVKANEAAEKTENLQKNYRASYIAYSHYEDGTDYTETWSAGQEYIGICNSSTAPTDKSDYSWGRFVQPTYEIASSDEVIDYLGDSLSP